MSEQRNEERGLPDAEFAALLQGIDAAAPLMKALLPQKPTQTLTTDDPCARREALLCALKPYLSKERCDAVDYLLRMWRTKEAIRAIGGLYVHSTDV